MRVGTWAWRVAALLLTFAPMSLAQPAAYAQSPAEFYKGRNVELYIGYSVGGAYDLYARVLARHLSKHIPGFEETLSRELIVGGTGQAADTDQFPRILNGVLGTKFRIVTGYPGGNDVTLAMERGEVKGRCGWSWSSVPSTHKRWIEDKSITVLVQLSLNKHPDLPDVPPVMDFAKTEDQQQMFKLIFARQVMGRPYLAPPDVPKERAEALRKAFMDTMKDDEFLADAEKSQLEITPVDGAEVEKLVRELYQTPKPLADKAAQFIRH